MQGLSKSIVPVLLTFALILTSSLSTADGHGEHAESTDPNIVYRQKVMEIVGTNMGAIGDILKNQLDQPGAIANHAGQMAESAALIGPAFKKNLSDGATDAKPEIWQDWAKFEKAITEYKTAAQGLQAAASGNNPALIGPAMKALGKSCGGCHKPFRKAKEDSFKNK